MLRLLDAYEHKEGVCLGYFGSLNTSTAISAEPSIPTYPDSILHPTYAERKPTLPTNPSSSAPRPVGCAVFLGKSGSP